MKHKSVLVSRYSAYGDAICISHLPHLLKDQGFDVIDFEVNFKALQVLSNNPYINSFKHYNPKKGLLVNGITDHWKEVSKGYDKFINLCMSLEHGCIALEDDKLYNESDEKRREVLGEINFYDQSTAWAGYPELCGEYSPELYFTKQEEHLTKQYMKQFKGKFTVLINLAGTSRHKQFIQAKEVCGQILSKYENAEIILTGDNKELVFTGDRITSIVGKKPFMQAVLISKYVDCVISMESGLGIGSNVWGTPTIFLLTSSSPMNVTKYAVNDLCLQSPAECSPCHKGPHEYRGCKLIDGNPCCIYFNINEIMDRVEIANRRSK